MPYPDGPSSRASRAAIARPTSRLQLRKVSPRTLVRINWALRGIGRAYTILVTNVAEHWRFDRIREEPHGGPFGVSTYHVLIRSLKKNGLVGTWYKGLRHISERVRAARHRRELARGRLGTKGIFTLIYQKRIW